MILHVACLGTPSTTPYNAHAMHNIKMLSNWLGIPHHALSGLQQHLQDLLTAVLRI